MNKSEFVKAICARTGMTQKDASAALDACCDIVGDTLAKGETIALVGFGSFEVQDRAERKGRNPRSGEEITIPAVKRAVFRPGSGLQAKLNA